jgi:hypothetical protein
VSEVNNPSPGGGGADEDPTWASVENLGTGIALLGAPFRTACEVALDGHTLIFRGDLAVSGGPGSGARIFDLPAAIPAPAAIIRLNVQGAATSTVGLNLNTDRTVTLAAGAPGTFLILDGCSIPGWT